MKPLFSNRVRSNTYITLNENEKLIKNEYEVPNIFNSFFIESVPNLGTKVDERNLCNASNISDPIEKAIQKCKNHSWVSLLSKNGIFCQYKELVFFRAIYCKWYITTNKTLRC